MNPERLKKLQAQADQVRIGGKGRESHKTDILYLKYLLGDESDGQTVDQS